jgi:Spy/CpxP family protein refolding chaperone
MKKLALLSSVVLSLALSANAVIAETRESVSAQLLAQSQQEPQSSQEFIDSLELTDEQREQIQGILETYEPEVSSTFQALQEAAQNLGSTISPNASENEIRIARQRVISIELLLRDLRFNELMAIRNELTVEQREQINQRLLELLTTQSSQ